MKPAVLSGMFIAFVMVLSGCGTYQYHANVQMRNVPNDAPIKLNVTRPVAVVVASSCVAPGTEEVLGKWSGWEVKGNLYTFTAAAVGTAKEALQRNNVTVSDNADKRLELSVVSATSAMGFWTFGSGVTMKVKTGGGTEKEYNAVRHHQNGYTTTPALEMAIGNCVVQMLTDKDIVAYLEQ